MRLRAVNYSPAKPEPRSWVREGMVDVVGRISTTARLAMKLMLRTLVICGWAAISAGLAIAEQPLEKGVRGVATKAPQGIKIDGDLSEFRGSFCTPVEYFHTDLKNRPAQFFYMWDEEAFYAGLRTLDEKLMNQAPDDRLWEGDGVEWYFDTRRGTNFRNTAWEAGAVHCYWTGLTNGELKSRFCLRPGYLDAIPKIGVEVGVKKTPVGLDVEFKLPWKNFPEFKAQAGAVIAVDSELCYSDGGPRLYRSFAFGSPLSVSQPASLGRIQLVDKLDTGHWKACGPVMMPIRVDVPWGQANTKAHAFGHIALPPDHADQIGKIFFETRDLDGEKLGEYPATIEVIEKTGNFARATAHWPIDDAPPGAHQVTAVVYGKDGQALTRVAPRLVSVNWVTGY